MVNKAFGFIKLEGLVVKAAISLYEKFLWLEIGKRK